jgi:hypothetical protein
VPTSGGWDVGAYQYASAQATTTVVGTGLNVGIPQYGPTSYSFTVTYSSGAGLLPSSVGSSVVEVIAPDGSVIMATAGTPVGNGTPDSFGDYQSVTVTYTITPPGGSWTSDDNGEYTIDVNGPPIEDAAGNTLPSGPSGNFFVETGSVFFQRTGLSFKREAGGVYLGSGSIILTNTGSKR